MIVTSFFQALRAGRELANAETWKDAQQLTNALTALLMALVALAPLVGVQVPLSEAQLVSLASGVFPVVVLFNWVAAAVSSKRVGLLPARRDADPAGTADGSGNGSAGRSQPAARPDPGADDQVPVLTQMDNRG